MKGDFRMRTVRDFAALIFVGMWLLVTLSACETSKHAEIMSTEPLRAQAQMATAPDTETEIELDQGGMPFEGQSIDQELLGLPEPLVFAPELPPSPAFPPRDEEPVAEPEAAPMREVEEERVVQAEEPVAEPEAAPMREVEEERVVQAEEPVAEPEAAPMREVVEERVVQAEEPAAEPEAAPMREVVEERVVQAEEPVAEPEAAPMREVVEERVVQAEEPVAEPEAAPMREVVEEEILQAKEPAAEPEMEIAKLEPSDFVPEAQEPEPEGRRVETVVDSGLADVFFDFDQYAIRSAAVPVLEKNAALLKQTYKDSTVLIGGYCDERGTVEYNLELGKRRAQAVKEYLVDLGVEESRIQIVSYGKEKSFCTESKPTCWQQNRRGHFVQRVSSHLPRKGE
jgi:peptidoglycan-associated lipoprotein